MKKVILSLALLAAAAGLRAQPPGQSVTSPAAPDDQVADIKFEKVEHNFGEVPQGPPSVTYVFKFKNTGKAPLIISQVTTSCGCTTPEYSMEPIAPGKSGEIKVGYNALNQGTFTKELWVKSNAKSGDVKLLITGTVVAPKPAEAPNNSNVKPKPNNR